MEHLFNPWAFVVASLIPLILGSLYYNPKLMGTAWMKSAGLQESDLKKGNMLLIFGLSIVFSFMLAFSLHPMVIHQFGIVGLFGGETPDSTELLTTYKDNFRSFGHGALHGAVMVGGFFVFPILAIIGLFERKSWKYIVINALYWIICLGIMGGIICGWTIEGFCWATPK